MVQLFTVIAAVSYATTAVLAHAPINPSHTALLKRREENLSLQRRLAEKCGPELARRRAERLARRAARAGFALEELHKRTDLAPRQSTNNSTRNITDGQAGLPLTVEVDFIDVETCQAVPNLWVDACILSSGGGFGGGNGSAPPDMTMSGSALPTGTAPAGNGTSATTTAAGSTSTKNAYSGADSTAAASMLNTVPTDQEIFLRGAWQADSDGHWTMHSIFPGWYSGRSIHFHVKVYENGSMAENGTFIAGRAMHTGQFFFNESITQEVAALAPYNTNTVTRLTNDEDQWYAYENAVGYDATMDVVYAGSSISDGLIGSIIVGLNTSYTSIELSTQWWAGNSSDSSSSNSTTTTTTLPADTKARCLWLVYLSSLFLRDFSKMPELVVRGL
ncbi:Aromatic compound dioxygenase [Rhizoctonia solani]|uniref:Aromatic compound dioxygenase n=1 Tax=Rhizoctonia solani TaxID=456999 RepID=A0A8H7M0Z5_9AGAM|nr:Aromatic compound dioxygenase [Rhizoctonia solani]